MEKGITEMPDIATKLSNTDFNITDKVSNIDEAIDQIVINYISYNDKIDIHRKFLLPIDFNKLAISIQL